jgi:hypothetical protein
MAGEFDEDRVEALAETKSNPSTVTAQFFDENGDAREMPDSVVVLDQVLDMVEAADAAAAEQVSAFDYPDVWAGVAGAAEFDGQAQREAATAAAAAQHEALLVDEVRRVGATKEFAVTDEDAVAHVASEVERARREWFDAQLAQGATVAQALQGLGALNVHAAIRVGLEEQRYFRLTERTRMARWARGQAEQARVDAAVGLPPRRSIAETSPGLQRMAKAMHARNERITAERNWFRDRGWA